MGYMFNLNSYDLCEYHATDATDSKYGFIIHFNAYVRRHGIVYVVTRLNVAQCSTLKMPFKRLLGFKWRNTRQVVKNP